MSPFAAVRARLEAIDDYKLEDYTKRLGENGQVQTRGITSRLIKLLHLDQIPFVKNLFCKGNIVASSTSVQRDIKTLLDQTYDTDEAYAKDVDLAVAAANKVNALIDKVIPKRPAEAQALRDARISVTTLAPARVPATAVKPAVSQQPAAASVPGATAATATATPSEADKKNEAATLATTTPTDAVVVDQEKAAAPAATVIDQQPAVVVDQPAEKKEQAVQEHAVQEPAVQEQPTQGQAAQQEDEEVVQEKPVQEEVVQEEAQSQKGAEPVVVPAPQEEAEGSSSVQAPAPRAATPPPAFDPDEVEDIFDDSSELGFALDTTGYTTPVLPQHHTAMLEDVAVERTDVTPVQHTLEEDVAAPPAPVASKTQRAQARKGKGTLHAIPDSKATVKPVSKLLYEAEQENAVKKDE